MNEPLAARNCVPCRGGVAGLDEASVAGFLRELDGWSAQGVHHIERDYQFKNFVEALEFVNKVGAVAEEQDHHPDIWFTWGKCKIEIRTHAIDGLTDNDFILAARIDQIEA